MKGELLNAAEIVTNDDVRGREGFCRYSIYLKDGGDMGWNGANFVKSKVFYCKQ
jgi:hypothetical protein